MASARPRAAIAASRPPVAISSPTSFLSAVRPSTIATSRPRYMTAIRSDSSRTSSSSAETSSIAVPASRFAIDLAMDELDAADVQAARRLIEDEQPQVAAELAGDDDLLLVAARQRAGRHVGRRRPDVVPRDEVLAPRSSIARSSRTNRRANGAR